MREVWKGKIDVFAHFYTKGILCDLAEVFHGSHIIRKC